MTIGELIEALRACEKDARVYYDFPGFQGPRALHSYRGYYDQPALGHERQGYDERDVRAHDFADRLEKSLGAVHTGWKGGDYRYTKDDTPFVANPGETSDVLVSGLSDEGYRAVILTEYRPS